MLNYTRSKWNQDRCVSASLVRVPATWPPSLRRFMLSLVAKVIVPVGLCTFSSPRACIRKQSMKRACNSLPITSDAEIIFASPFGLHLCKPFTWTLCPGPATVWIIYGHLHSPPTMFCSARGRGGGEGEFLISFGRAHVGTARYLYSRRRLAESKSDRKFWLQSTSEGNGQILRELSR